jgi:alkylation response protein AidB-like acyl-CoA dehydrogenase
MDFALNEQQEMMQTLARDFLKAEYPEKVLRAMIKDETGHSPEFWRKMAELNLTGLAIPEKYGGVGDFLDLMVVLEEMGKAGLIGPFFSTVVLGATTIVESGSEEQKAKYLPEIASGKLILTLALAEPSGKYTASDIKTKANKQGNQFIISGSKMFVPDASVADCLIVAARTSEASDPRNGISLFLVDGKSAGIKVQPLKTISGEKQYEVIFENVEVPAENVLGEMNRGWQYIEKVLAKAAVAACAEMVGGANQVLDVTLTYAKERMAFGHPIGAFQSIQHSCTDMFIDVEGSRFVTYQAGWKLNEGLPAEKEVSVAKAWVSQAFRRVVTSSHQVHGAIGFSEDHILHLYTKRARALEFSFGDVAFHLDKLAAGMTNK